MLEIYAQILNLKWQLNAEIINQGLKIVNSINDAKRFQKQYEEDKKRIDFKYKQIMKMRKKYENTDNH